jgi:E3 ubiquitin-protein ligase SHPRH
MQLLHPRHLADADIVLTTFDALMGDLSHSDENRFIPSSGNKEASGYLRKRKRYRAIPSPLLSIDWWRVCLDEAQRVETPTAGSSRMALKLTAEHRWCVTGTPVGRGKLEDLFGLLLFLRVVPFSSKIWFSKCMSPENGHVDCRISHLLQHVFWRSTKSFDVVLKQMGVPEQVEKKIVLHASSIEKHFYDRQVRFANSIKIDLVSSTL